MKLTLRALAVATLAAALPLGALAQDASPEPLHDGPGAEYLAVVSGTSGSMDGTTLTLEGVEGILVFADRPQRQAFFAPLGAAGALEAEFEGDPPNAVLSVFADEAAENTVVVLTDVVDVGETSMTLAYSLLEGEPPDGGFGPASLFIDPSAPVVVDRLCVSVLADPANEPTDLVEFCTEREG